VGPDLTGGTRKKKVHAQASCLWSGKVAGTRRVARSAVVARTMGRPVSKL
jgi:hypothetical protein